MNWNFDMSQAPRGQMKTKTVTRLNKAGETVESSYEAFVADKVLLALQSGEVISSYWIPPAYSASGALLEGNRWSGLNVSSNPVAWAAWPEPPAVQQKAVS